MSSFLLKVGIRIPMPVRGAFTHVGLRAAPPLFPKEVTQPLPTPPSLPQPLQPELASTIDGPLVYLQGKTLELLHTGVRSVLTFPDADPHTFRSAAARIEAQHPHLRAFHAEGVFYLQSRLAGPHTYLEVLGGDAAGILGLPLHLRAYGAPARPRLPPGEMVFIDDPTSLPGQRYQYRLSREDTGECGDWSPPFYPSDADPIETVEVYATFVDPAGRRLPHQVVTVYPSGTVLPAGLMTGAMDFAADDRGLLKMHLVRGVTYLVVVAGTKRTQRVQVPTDPSVTSVSLFEGPYSAEVDPYQVQTPELAEFYSVRTL